MNSKTGKSSSFDRESPAPYASETEERPAGLGTCGDGGESGPKRLDVGVRRLGQGFLAGASLVLNAAQGLARPSTLIGYDRCSGDEVGGHLGAGAMGGDLRVPGLTGGDHRVQVPQDRGDEHGLRLGGLELVVLAGARACGC